MKNVVVCLLTSLVVSLLGSAAPEPETYSGEIMDSACAKAGSHSGMMKNVGAKNAKECTQACINMGSKYVLYDSSSKKTYQLDDQTKPGQFAGEKATVKGRLGANGQTIHVTEIEIAKAAGK